LLEKRQERNIPNKTIRQILLAPVKEFIQKTDPSALAEICVLGKDFNPPDFNFHEATMTTTVVNASYGIYLSTSDTGLIMLQKIATASILVGLIKLINHGQPAFDKIWKPSEILSVDQINGLSERKIDIAHILGW
jgi:hypothetical protein